MFAALFAFLLVTAYAAEEIPSYIHVCGRNDPNYNQCFVDNINNVKSMICTGIPELNVLPAEPLIIDKIIIYDTNNLKLDLQNSKITGVCDFVVTSIYTSPEKDHFEFNFILKHLNMDSIYNFDIRILVPLTNKGLVHIFRDNLYGKLTFYLKEVTKKGKKQIYVARANTILDIKSFSYDFDDSEKDLVQLHEVFRNTISENEKEIISKVKPLLEGAVSKLGISVINNITHNRYEQLFPDETL